jgi:hypothetical protein
MYAHTHTRRLLVKFQGAHDHAGAQKRTNEYPVKLGDVLSVTQAETVQFFDNAAPGELSDTEPDDL